MRMADLEVLRVAGHGSFIDAKDPPGVLELRREFSIPVLESIAR
jgi:hypothetical protein